METLIVLYIRSLHPSPHPFHDHYHHNIYSLIAIYHIRIRILHRIYNVLCIWLVYIHCGARTDLDHVFEFVNGNIVQLRRLLPLTTRLALEYLHTQCIPMDHCDSFIDICST
jgi:hypothetical protein